MSENFRESILQGIPEQLPPYPPEDPEINRAPKRPVSLSQREKMQALANVLRYLPSTVHKEVAKEFARELEEKGRIYAYRYRPDYPMYARPIDEYPAQNQQAAAIMLMINNNLDPEVAQYPYELITYGGNGSVFQNWLQYRLTMQYLSQLREDQTLVLYSGHPLGVFPSHPDAPRIVITNGMIIPHFASEEEEYHRLAALGVTMYGQMTAGSFMYIGPQGIVHGTTLTILNAARLYLNLPPDRNLKGKLFVSSGLGGMSGAQAKAAVITGAVGVIAEINPKALAKRKAQGWLQEAETDLDKVIKRMEQARKNGEALSLGYLGNVVDLWEKLVKEGIEVDLGSDQTSLHIPYSGGYYPVGYSFEEANELLRRDPEGFKKAVNQSLHRHFKAISTLADRGMKFWDYGNSFLYQAEQAGVPGVKKPDGSYRFPSYVEHIMGPLFFDFGFGPFRWIVTSGRPEDLEKTDAIAAEVLERLSSSAPEEIKQQIRDNLYWIKHSAEHKLVVGSQARILYSDAFGRIAIAEAFNRAIRDGIIRAPIVIGRDHHDVGGTDSPLRETANIYDGSNLCADMAVQNAIGDSFRGATWVSLHNGGGVGWGKAINGGFGLVLDGSEAAERRLKQMLFWDVNNGIARRAWAGNPNAISTAKRTLESEPLLKLTLPNLPDQKLLEKIFTEK